MPAGSIYSLSCGKSVENFIPGGAAGRPVSLQAAVFELKYLWPDSRAIRVSSARTFVPWGPQRR
jgi:hypothetical protein